MSQNEYLEKIGSLITQVRQERGLTQLEFAKRLKTSQSAINRIEKGRQNLSLDMLSRISEVLEKQLIALGSPGITFRIEGGHKLHGAITCNTSKNAAVGLLCGSLLNYGTTTLKSVPRIEEVYRIIEVLESIGVTCRWLPGNDLEIKRPTTLRLNNMNHVAARRTRSVIMLIGALMHDHKEFSLPYAGGCQLGKRTVLPHLYALEHFGVDIAARSGFYRIKVSKSRKDRTIVMYEASDTATENVLFAAALTPGTTVIKMASANYMVQDVCYFLETLGVRIEGIGTTTLTVTGVDRPISRNVTYAHSEDPVEAMTFVSAAVTTNSKLTINRVPLEFMELELYKLEKMGLKITRSAPYLAANNRTTLADITIHPHNGALSAPPDKIDSRPFPGLNIDHLPYFVPIAAVAKGRTLIHDWVYEDRALMYTEMKKIGVDVALADPHRCFVTGPTKWRAADITCPSGIRPAVMLMIGMLAAPGISMLRNAYTVNRGYEDLATRLSSIGAHISIVRV